MKFIILNGSPGVGKSTLAKKLNAHFTPSYLLDVDEHRYNISDYKHNKELSYKVSFSAALSVVEVCLSNELDLILDKMMYPSHDMLEGVFVLDSFLEIAKEYSADVYEFILYAEEKIVLERLEGRGYKQEGLNTPEKALEHLNQMLNFKNKRKSAIHIDTSQVSPEELFNEVITHIT